MIEELIKTIISSTNEVIGNIIITIPGILGGLVVIMLTYYTANSYDYY
jgi:uncharacterized membrane-anchored protein